MVLAAFRRGRAWRAAGVAVLVLATATPVGHASFPGRNGRLAMGYQFNGCDVELAIATMRPNGTQRRLLTRPACDEQHGGNAPDWAPDGRRLVYLTDEGEAGWGTGRRLAVINPDGTGRTLLPIAPVYESPFAGEWYDDSPSFAPDGEHLAYARLTTGPNGGRPASAVWISRLDGTGSRRLRAGRRPRWSPDGRHIAYLTRGGGLDLMRADNGVRSRVLVRRDVCAADWSPTGRRLVYSQSGSRGGCEYGHVDVFVIQADGTGMRRLIEMPRASGVEENWRAEDVAWSPDGRRIAFVRAHQAGDATSYSLVVTSARGRNAKRVYGTPRDIVGEGFPDYGPTISWQPLVP